MSMKERRKARREARRSTLRTVAAAPSFKAVRTKRATRSRVRMAMVASAVLSVLMTMLFVAPQAARAGLQDAPEIDPGSMAGALTLLVGGVLALTDRVRRV